MEAETEKKGLSRIQKAKPHLQMMAQLLYIMDQKDPKDYLVLAFAKYFKHISAYAKAETIRHLLSMPEKEFYTIVNRMRDKGWVVIEGEYINVSGAGDHKLTAVQGWISYALYNIQERIPLEQWSKLLKK